MSVSRAVETVKKWKLNNREKQIGGRPVDEVRNRLEFLLAVGLGITGFVVWFFMLRGGGKKKRKHRHRKHRRHNPTLAETGGLPPMRAPDQPPKGT